MTPVADNGRQMAADVTRPSTVPALRWPKAIAALRYRECGWSVRGGGQLSCSPSPQMRGDRQRLGVASSSTVVATGAMAPPGSATSPLGYSRRPQRVQMQLGWGGSWPPAARHWTDETALACEALSHYAPCGSNCNRSFGDRALASCPLGGFGRPDLSPWSEPVKRICARTGTG